MDGIERSLEGKATIYRLNVSTTHGLQVAARYGLRGLPTLMVFDGHGAVVLRQVGRLRKDEVLGAVQSLVASPAH